MRCRNCGEEIPDRALVCGKCGTPVDERDRPKDAFRSEEEEPPEENVRMRVDRGGEDPGERCSYAGYRTTDDDRSYAGYRNTDDDRSYAGNQNADERHGYAGDRKTGNGPEDTSALTGREGLARAGMILALISFPLCVVPVVSIVTSIAAIILGVLGLNSQKQNRAIAAIVIGIAMLLFSMAMIVAIAVIYPYMDDVSQMFNTFVE